MEQTVNIPIKPVVEEFDELTCATLAAVFSELGYGKSAFEDYLHALNDWAVETYCGEKHARGNGEKRFQRGPTKVKTVVTLLGEHTLTLQWVNDTAAPADESAYFRPIEEIVSFAGQKTYQEDVALMAAELATKMSYRDAKAEGERFTPMPSPTTINDCVFTFGEEMQAYVRENIDGKESETVYPDATKCHSQEESSQHEIQVTLGEADDAMDLLDVRVDGSWEESAASLEKADAIDETAEIVSDGDEPMINAFLTDDRVHQLDLLHYVHTSAYKLWEDGELDLETRNQIQTQVESLVFHLKNSVEKHRQEGDTDAIDHRIEQTIDGLHELADDLDKRGCRQTATYLRKWSNRVVTFAKLAVDDLTMKVPWTSNVVERLMGEISKRCKHKWMRWTSKGLESILRLLLVRYTKQPLYEAFVEEKTHQSTVAEVTARLKASSTRGVTA